MHFTRTGEKGQHTLAIRYDAVNFKEAGSGRVKVGTSGGKSVRLSVKSIVFQTGLYPKEQ